MRRYLFCLSQRHALGLLSSNFFGRLPNGMGALAIVLFLRAHHASYREVGIGAAAYGLCAAAGGPVLGRMVDKRGQPVTLLSGAVGSGAGFLLLALSGTGPLALKLAGIVLAGLLMPPLEPALRSLWPSVLPDQETVEVAYALDTALQNILFVSGPLLVVLIIDLTTSALTLVIIGLLGVLGTGLFVLYKPVQRWRGPAGARHWAGPLRSRLLVLILVSMACVGAVVGVFNVATVAYAEQHHLKDFSGVLLGGFSLGSLIGGLAYGAMNRSGDPLRHMWLLVLGFAVCTWPLMSVADAPIMALLMLIAGLALAPMLTCGFVVIGKLAPQGTVTEAFAWVTALFLGGSALGSMLTGVVLSGAGLRSAFAVAGMLATAGFLVILLATSDPWTRRPFSGKDAIDEVPVTRTSDFA
jgi:MFS family permease